MQVLTQLAALLREGDQYTIRLRGTKDGTQVVIEAALANVDPDEPNEALRNIQSALALPLFVTIPRNESVSIALPAALDAWVGAKANAVEARDMLTSAIQQAASEAKGAAAKVTQGKGGKKPAAVEPVESAGASESAGATPAPSGGSPTPAAASAISVFDND